MEKQKKLESQILKEKEEFNTQLNSLLRKIEEERQERVKLSEGTLPLVTITNLNLQLQLIWKA